MAQYKKDKIKESIDDAALTVFSKKGYQAAKIADISACCGVSVGNIYRYYKNKDELFYSVVPECFPDQLLGVIRDKISAAKDNDDAGSIQFKEVTQAFFHFMLTNQKKILIVLTGSKGTKYSDMRSQLAGSLLSVVKAIYEEKYIAYINSYGSDKMLHLIYENLITAYCYVLNVSCTEKEMVNLIQQINLYHFSGITSLLDI